MESTSIIFPFQRGRSYRIGELRAFQDELAAARKANPQLSADLRCNRPSGWAKIQNEELLPIRYFADGKGLSDEALFTLMPVGDAVDVRLVVDGAPVDLQITVADPEWGDSDGTYVHSLHMELLRQGKPAWLGARTRKDGGVIVSEPHVRDLRDDIAACEARIVKAIERKQTHDGTGCTLLIYARYHWFFLIDADIDAIVANAVRKSRISNFDGVCVVDEKFFWEKRLN